MNNKISIDKVKYGIKRTTPTAEGTFRVEHVCSCGSRTEGVYVQRRDIPSVFECQDCGNDMFYGKFDINKPFTAPHFSVDFKNNRGFGVSRTNVTVEVKEDDEGNITGIEIIRVNMSRKIVFDYVDDVLMCYRNGEIEYDFKRDRRNYKSIQQNYNNPNFEIIEDEENVLRRINNFVFRNVTFDEFLGKISTRNSKAFYEYVNNNAGYDWNSRNNKQILSRFVTMLLQKKNYNWAQVLSSAGFDRVDEISRVTIWKRTNDYYNRRIEINKEGTTPAEILNVPKSFVKYVVKASRLKYYLVSTTLKEFWRLQEEQDDFDYNKVLRIISFVKDDTQFEKVMENLGTAYQVIDEYGGKAHRILEYLLEELPMYQGIVSFTEGVGLLRDYIDMCKKMSYEPEKYPKSLKKVHDIAMVNYSKFKDSLNEDDFRIAVSKYIDLQWVGNKNKYSFIVPESPKEMVMEGNALNHCIASYTNRVMSNSTNIIFMRENTDLDKPLVSIEVKDGRVVQARGKGNRTVTEAEDKTIKDWAKKKNLFYSSPYKT